MNIRPVELNDMPQITAIYGRSVREEFVSFEHVPPSLEEMTQRMQALAGQNYPYLVAEIDGQVAGYCYVSSYRPRPAYDKTVESTVYVSPQFWRRGVARGLLVALIEQCWVQQYRQIIAIAACQDDVDLGQVASIQLHLNVGFVDAGRLGAVGYKHGQWLDIVLLQYSL